MKVVLLVLCSFFFFQQTGSAEEQKKGWLREKLKERWIKKQHEKPAPEASGDVTSKISTPGTYTFSLKHGNIDRYYILHVPAKYKPEAPATLMLALHGGGGNMNIQAKDEFYKQISKSEKEGFIVAFPNGFSKLKSGKFATWNAGKCCGDARDQQVDDVGFLKEMISAISRQLSINQDKIFSNGMSNGAMMSYRLACELSGTIKGIAAVAGTDNTIECTPPTPVNILHIHAKNDEHVLFGGGAGKKASEASKITDFKSVPDTISKWVAFNKCDATPHRVLEKSGAYCDLYTKCKNNVRVQLCVTDSGGHSWPGGKKPRGQDETSKAISANDVMWDFFEGR